MSDIPVVIFAYNRPDKLSKVLDALRTQDVARLIVFVDGPRNSSDARGVEACRELANAICWTQTELHLSEINQGVASIKEKIDGVFEHNAAAIFLEDDCLPVPGFYRFMCAALDRYQQNPQVFSIGGYQHLKPEVFRGYPFSLVSGARFIGWGWATWQDRWRRALPLIENFHSLFYSLRKVPEVAGSDIGQTARRMAVGRGLDNWDIRVTLAALMLKQVHLVPVEGLVRAIGLDSSGMHGSFSNILRARFLHNRNVAERAPDKIVWIEDVSANCEYMAGVRDFVSLSSALSLGRTFWRGWGYLRRTVRIHPERLRSVYLSSREPTHLNKRALISYIIHPFLISEDDARFHRHVNIWHARDMVRILNDMGYQVDVIDYRDESYQPEGLYDLFIGHGGINFARIAAMLPRHTPKIYFSTGAYWRFHNLQEQQRFEDLRQRRGVALPPDRAIRIGEEQALQVANGIIGIGNEFTRQTYKDWGRVWMVPGTAKFDDTFDWCPIDLQAGRNNFLYFASTGNVHKGLDLLLEAFTCLEQDLWVMSPLEAGFRNAFRHELYELPNIHTLGYVMPRSSLYYRTLRRCAWCILPSCSEGQAQSVVEAMNAGLIPLVSRASGVDTDDFGEWIEPVTIESIRSCVANAAQLSLGEIHRRSLKARQAADTIYSPDAFGRNFREALEAAMTGSGDNGADRSGSRR